MSSTCLFFLLGLVSFLMFHILSLSFSSLSSPSLPPYLKEWNDAVFVVFVSVRS